LAPALDTVQALICPFGDVVEAASRGGGSAIHSLLILVVEAVAGLAQCGPGGLFILAFRFNLKQHAH
jgi:hypothetical protein